MFVLDIKSKEKQLLTLQTFCFHICISLHVKLEPAMARAAIDKNNKKDEELFTSKLDWNLRNKLVKCYIWNIALFGYESPTFENYIRNTLELLKWVVREGRRRTFGRIACE